MTEAELHKERQILMAMRKTLARIIRDLTPSDTATQYPLTDETVEDVKQCFNLIAARERELAKMAGVEPQERPHFIDEPRNTTVVSIASIQRKEKE